MPENASPQNRYQLGEVLGRGGMGVVYKAYDRQMKREVALKTLLDVDDKTALEQFYKECGLLATMVHPNIVGIYDVGEFELEGVKQPFFVMPLLEGETLEQLIRKRSPRLTVETSVAILAQAARGLQAAHELELIHRDMKPSNIFVMPDNSVKLIDFGIARLARASSGTTLRGTVSYVAPELFGKQALPSALSDLFSLAVVSYEMLAGRRPFQGTTDSEMVAAVLRHNPPPLADLNPQVNYAVCQVIHKGLAKQPWHRFGSVREYGEALGKALRNEPLEALDPATIQPRIDRATRATERQDYELAAELLAELEAEGRLDLKITLLRRQLDHSVREVRISKLVEAARRFYASEEYSLALRKIQEVLEADPQHTDALALQAQIGKAQASHRGEEWLEAARQSLEKREFRQARESLERARRARPGDPDAERLAAEIERREQEMLRAREQKARLYKQAMEGWEKGDVSVAYQRLEALLVLAQEQPDPAGQGDLYRRFHEEVKAAREAIQGAHQQARRLLDAGDTEGALAISRQYLARYPGHALFQSVRWEAEEKRRLQVRREVEEAEQRAEQEPAPERRVAILEEALARHPGQGQLEQALALAREKRNLVDSVVARARYLEESARWGESLEQWEMVGTICPEYPGLEAECERVAAAREAAGRVEAAPPEPVAEPAPEDALTQAAAAPPHVFPEKRPSTREVVNALVEEARGLAGQDPDAAEALVERALAVSPEHAGAQALRDQIARQKRDEYLSWCASQARRKAEAGDREGARALVEQALLAYPEDAELHDLRESLAETVVNPEASLVVEAVEEPAAPSEAPRSRPLPWRRWWPAAALGLMFVTATVVVSLVARSKRPRPAPAPPARVVSISAHPAGATLLVNGATCGVSQCEPRLAAGTYHIEARLTGYQPARAELAVGDAGAGPLLLRLTPLGTVLRVTSDLEGAEVRLDGQPVGKIENGELEVRDLSAGAHRLSLAAAAGRVTVEIETAEASPPWLRQPLETRGLRTIVVAGMGSSGRAWANLRNAEAAVDGQAAGQVTAEGVPLGQLGEGPHELTLKAGTSDPHTLFFQSEAGPVLTAFVGSDRSLGSLRINAGLDGVAVFLNGQRHRRTTEKGRLALALAPRRYTVRVTKEGFLTPPDQTVEVKGGVETQVDFRLGAAPKFAAFRVRNGTPGAEVAVDGAAVGSIGADGTFTLARLDPPGRHTVVVRKESHQPRQYDQEFPAGVTVELEGSLETAVGTLRIEASPLETRVTLRRDGESAERTLSGTTVEVPEGSYRVTGSAAGHTGDSVTVRVTAGRTATATLALKRVETPKPAPQTVLTLADWEKTGGWTREGTLLWRRGGNVVVAPLAPMPGTYIFTILLQRGARLEWLLNYKDDRNHVQYQLDRNNFSRVEVAEGRRSAPARTPHQVDRDGYISIQIDVSREAILHRIQREGQWQFLDEFRKPGADMLAGPFALRIGGRDQIGLSDFRFLPR